jgi:hypothetical protein
LRFVVLNAILLKPRPAKERCVVLSREIRVHLFVPGSQRKIPRP